MKKNILIAIIVLVIQGCATSGSTSKSNLTKKEQDLAKLKFGIEVTDLNDSNKGNSQLSHGVVITNVYSFYPASKAGILKGDILINLNNETIFNLEGFKKLLQSYKYVYGQVTLGISRDSQIQKIKVYLD